MNGLKKCQKGFTLVEVLVAATVMTVVVVAVGSLFITSLKANAAAGDQTACVALAQERLESLRHVDYETLTQGGDLDAPVANYHQYVDGNADGSNDFLVTWRVQWAPTVSGSLSGSKLHVTQLDARCKSLRSAKGQPGNPKVVTIGTFRAKGVE